METNHSNGWLSPVESERKWQEEKLKSIFPYWPGAYPKWQYLNTFIHITEEKIKQDKKLSSLELTLKNIEDINLSQLSKEELEKHCKRLLIIIEKLK